MHRAFLLFSLISSAPVFIQAQQATEWQVQSAALLGEERFWGAGVGMALRTNGRMRVGLAVNAGELDGGRAIRPELLGSFHLNPYKRQGVSPYAGGGVAAVFTEASTREYIVAFLGLESRPGRKFGWFAELGLGGGVRLAAGVQYRKRGSRAR